MQEPPPNQPGQLRSFLRACVNSIRINARLQHLDLVSHQLKSGVVSSAELRLQKLLKNQEYSQITVHLPSNPITQIHLKINRLTRLICFRTPRENKEFENLQEWSESIHPKAGFWSGKLGLQTGGVTFATTGVERRSGSHCCTIRSSVRMIRPKCETSDFLTLF